MNVVCIIQARMGSSRLPGKVLLELGGASMLQRVVSRALLARTVSRVIVATTTDAKDEAIADALVGGDARVSVFRGSEQDVLDRYYQAAKAAQADIVVRVTSDCPLIDPDVIDRVVQTLTDDPSLQYAANILGRRTYPRGLDVEVVIFEALEETWRVATESDDREHVTLYIRKHPEKFRACNVEGEADFSHHRWTVDEESDYRLIEELIRRLPAGNSFRTADVLSIFETEPELFNINRQVQQKHFDGRKVLACIQARMGSTRLPKKVLMDLNGAPVLAQIARRLKACKNIDMVAVATSTQPENDVIVETAKAHRLPVYAGSENDIVDRMYGAAREFGATAVVRITADCPLVDPRIVDEVVASFLQDPSLDYVSNIMPPTFPDGLDVELISTSALTRLWERTRADAFRGEWFNQDIRENPALYRTKNLAMSRDHSQMRWTVDYPEDMEFAREVFARLSPNGEVFAMGEVMELLARHPQIEALNSKYIRDEAYLKAIAERVANV